MCSFYCHIHHSDAFVNHKTAAKTNAINNTPPLSGQLSRKTCKFSPPKLFNIERRRQCQTLAYRPTYAPNEAPRPVKHECCRVGYIRARGCRMMNVQKSLTGCEHNKAYVLVI